MNLANKLTMLRVVMIPAFVIVLYADFEGCRYVALALFAIASFTDFLDGYIARSRNLVTDFGKFMDPLADKVLVMTAMLMFVSWGQMPAWVLAVVLARELAVSGLRMICLLYTSTSSRNFTKEAPRPGAAASVWRWWKRLLPVTADVLRSATPKAAAALCRFTCRLNSLIHKNRTKVCDSLANRRSA